MTSSSRIFGREPALWLAALQSLLMLAAVGTPLTDGQAASIIALISAVGGAVMAWQTRPIAPAAFTGVVTTGVALVAAFGYDVPADVVAGVNAVLVSTLALVVRGEVEPFDSRISRG